VNGGGAKHHPKRFVHMMRGEIIVYSFAMILLEGLYLLRDDIITNKIVKPSELLGSE
jgi:hypothetical protein